MLCVGMFRRKDRQKEELVRFTFQSTLELISLTLLNLGDFVRMWTVSLRDRKILVTDDLLCAKVIKEKNDCKSIMQIRIVL